MTTSEAAERTLETEPVAAPEAAGTQAPDEDLVETLVEEVSIDGMCGVY